MTGAGGYIGSVATYLLLKKGYEVVALDNFQTGFRQPLQLLQQQYGKEKLRWYEKDIHDDLSSIFQENQGISAALHYAASALVDESMKNPDKYFYNNVCGSQNLFSALLKNGVHHVVFSSTCAVYGDAQNMPIDEAHPTIPSNPYGESKLMVERMLKWYELQGLHYVTLRYFNVCGATDDGLVGYSKRPFTHLIENVVRGALNLAQFHLTYQKFDTKDGSPVRDYINVLDLNDAHIRAVEYLANKGKTETVNLGTGTGQSVLEIVDKVQKITGVRFPTEKTEAREGEYPEAVAKIEKAKEILGWAPQHSLEQSIQSTIAWYKTHPNGWE